MDSSIFPSQTGAGVRVGLGWGWGGGNAKQATIVRIFKAKDCRMEMNAEQFSGESRGKAWRLLPLWRLLIQDVSGLLIRI